MGGTRTLTCVGGSSSYSGSICFLLPAWFASLPSEIARNVRIDVPAQRRCSARFCVMPPRAQSFPSTSSTSTASCRGRRSSPTTGPPRSRRLLPHLTTRARGLTSPRRRVRTVSASAAGGWSPSFAIYSLRDLFKEQLRVALSRSRAWMLVHSRVGGSFASLLRTSADRARSSTSLPDSVSVELPLATVPRGRQCLKRNADHA